MEQSRKQIYHSTNEWKRSLETITQIGLPGPAVNRIIYIMELSISVRPTEADGKTD
ncbi:Hypothetical protein BIBO2_0345 [Brucella sp. BO2]|nr:Hypothetical protein BIBO2_0345 [Brucella sp. BO2]